MCAGIESISEYLTKAVQIFLYRLTKEQVVSYTLYKMYTEDSSTITNFKYFYDLLICSVKHLQMYYNLNYIRSGSDIGHFYENNR